jgi:phosphoribosylaminoimidazole (AIR) synthetase
MITYFSAGVDVDRGNALVDLLRPLCKSTHRPGCLGEIGGFAGAFDLAQSGVSPDSLLVATTDGERSPRRLDPLGLRVDGC